MFRVQCLIKHFADEELAIDPTGDDCDNSGGSFLMFAIRDALEFGGLLPHRKKNPAMEIRVALYKFDFLTEKTEELSKIIGNLEG